MPSPPAPPSPPNAGMTAVALRGAGLALVLGAAAGALLTTQAQFAVGRFGAHGLVASSTVLALVRVVGPHLAFMSAAVAATSALERRCDPGRSAPRPWALAGLVVLLLPFALASGMIGTAVPLYARGEDFARVPWFLESTDFVGSFLGGALRGGVLAVAWPWWSRVARRLDRRVARLALAVATAYGLSSAIQVAIEALFALSGTGG